MTNMSVSGFLSKTYEIFSDPNNVDICSWGVHGDTIHVKKIEEFSKYILPKYFKHSNFQSFVRQLNMYDFHKTVQDPGNGEFQHPYFMRDRPDLLVFIKRKAHNSKSKRLGGGFDASALNPDEITSESDMVLNELMAQRTRRDEYERRIQDLEAQQIRIAQLESQQARISAENNALKQMMNDSKLKYEKMQDRMERVLHVLYQVFVASGAVPSRSLMDGMRVLRSNSIQNSPSPSSADHVTAANAMLDAITNSSTHTDLTNTSAQLQPYSSFAGNGAHLTSLDSTSLEHLLSFDALADAAAGLPSDTLKSQNSLQVEPIEEVYSPGQVKPVHTSGQLLSRKSSIDPYGSLEDNKQQYYTSESQKRTSSSLESNYAQHDADAAIAADAVAKRPRIEGVNDADISESLHPDIEELCRNQNATLSRLDSLESTLASLLDLERDEDGVVLHTSDDAHTEPTESPQLVNEVEAEER